MGAHPTGPKTQRKIKHPKWWNKQGKSVTAETNSPKLRRNGNAMAIKGTDATSKHRIPAQVIAHETTQTVGVGTKTILQP